MKRWLWIRSKWRIRTIAYAFGGIGDELLLTAVVRQARLAGKPLHVLTKRPEIWMGNTDVLGVETNGEWWLYGQKRQWLSGELTHVSYQTGPPLHLAQQMARHFGLELPPGWHPIFRHTAAPRLPRRLVVQNSCCGALYAAPTKEWPQDRWTELMRRLAPGFEIIQIGTKSDPVLAGAVDRRGQTTLREAADLLATAGVFVGLESGLMHVAAATQTPSVIIYGGRSRPHETGYEQNANLFLDPGCAGCGLNRDCPNEMKCMEISVDEVEAAIRRQLTMRAASSPGASAA